uniref:Tail protein n=1 Tax=viral metagenome TaxID=1070528 RepID=A0A6M3IQK5_9ZZZZ
MAEGDGLIYNILKGKLFQKQIDMENDTLKLALVTGYTPDIDTHVGYSDISGSELSGTGYTAGGAALANATVTIDTDNDKAYVDADNVTWAAIDAGTPSHAILYSDTATGKPLICYWELTTATNGGSYTLAFDSGGIIEAA